MRVVQGSSYRSRRRQLGRFHLVVMGRSFHWMDRVDTLRRLDALVEPDGAVALFADRYPELPVNAWRQELRALTDRYIDRAKHWRGPDWVRHEVPLLESAFSQLEEIAVIEPRAVTAPRSWSSACSRCRARRARSSATRRTSSRRMSRHCTGVWRPVVSCRKWSRPMR